MNSNSLYVYGFVRGADIPEVGEAGLGQDGRATRVFPVNAGRVAAMVSVYGSERRVLPLRRNLEPHHRVVSELTRATTVVPVAFGHVVTGEKELKSFLRANADAICAELDRLQGKVEMGVRVRWDVENIFRHIVEGDPELAASRDQVFAAGAKASPAEKLELGRMFEERLQAARATLTERVLESLSGAAAQVRSNPPTTEETVADLAFLVDRDAQERFEDRVGEMAALWPPEYVFQCTGPWAPFNFVEAQLSAMGADEGREQAC